MTRSGLGKDELFDWGALDESSHPEGIVSDLWLPREDTAKIAMVSGCYFLKNFILGAIALPNQSAKRGGRNDLGSVYIALFHRHFTFRLEIIMNTLMITNVRKRGREYFALVGAAFAVSALVGLYTYENIFAVNKTWQIFYSILLSLALVMAGFMSNVLVNHVPKWIEFGLPYTKNGFIFIPIRALISDDGVCDIRIAGRFNNGDFSESLTIMAPISINKNEWSLVSIKWDDISYLNRFDVIIRGTLGHTCKELIEHYVISNSTGQA